MKVPTDLLENEAKPESSTQAVDTGIARTILRSRMSSSTLEVPELSSARPNGIGCRSVYMKLHDSAPLASSLSPMP
jgi:hypothetical protein